jgi:chorismate mutase
MQLKAQPRYYLVNAEMLPEIFLKVVEAKELLKTGEAATVAEAVGSVGISRSAFYKYKDAVSPFQDLKRGQIATFQFLLRDHMGVLSAVLLFLPTAGQISHN